MAKVLNGIGFLFFGFFEAVSGFEYCGNLNWCQDGQYCCHFNNSCCDLLSEGIIAGILVVVGTCTVVCIICMRRRHGQTGTVVVGQNQLTSGVVVASSTFPYQQGYGYQLLVQNPPPYGQPASYVQSAPYSQPGKQVPYAQPTPAEQCPYAQPASFGQAQNQQTTNMQEKATAQPPYSSN